MAKTISSKSKAVRIQTSYPHSKPILNWIDGVLRRLIDIVISSAGLLVLSPTFLMIAASIKHDSPGPVFYKGRRMGRGGKEFKILKFRTMYDGEDKPNDAKVTAEDDPRITPFGKWLRDSKINELPQLWNVLIGDMSLVGPRPEDPDIARAWPADYRRVLLSVRPGVTSPATVLYRDEETMLSTEDVMQDYLKEILPTKMRLDNLYVRNRSITTDLDVLFWTTIALLPKIRQVNVPQHYLYWGPISRIFGRYISWFGIDTLIALAAVSVSGVIWRLAGPLDIGVGNSILYAFGISLFFSVMNWIFGMNRVEWSRAQASDSITLGISTTLSALAVITLDALHIYYIHLPIPLIVISAVLSFLGFVGARYRERLITGTATRWLKIRGGVHNVGERVLIVGAGENSGLASWIFERSTLGRAAFVVGSVDDDPRKQGLRIEGYEVLGSTSDIPSLVEKHDIGLLIFTIDNIVPAQRARILSLCRQAGVKVVVLPDILDILRKEMKAARNPAASDGVKAIYNNAQQLLDEIQSLLVEYNVEGAQELLTQFRQQFHPNHH